LFHGKELIRPTLAQMLRNPVYVQADLDVYEFFKSQGTVIVNDVADFTGMNGCYLYQGRDVKASKKNDLKDQMLETAGEIVSQDSDTEQAYLAFICKRLKLNFRKLSVEERKWLKKIAEKSDLLKNPKPQRGRR